MREALLAILLLVSLAAQGDERTPIARNRTAEQQIALLQKRLLPAVVVRGDKPDTKGLLIRMRELNVPAASVAVIRAGKIEWARGFGVTRNGGLPVTTETLFQAASISKPVTAFGVMRLVQDKKLSLDVDVNQYLKLWKVPIDDNTKQSPITLRELLTHSAGITVHGFAGYEAGAPLPTLLQILNGVAPANSPSIRVDIAPGKTFRYSGGGYEIAQEVLTDVTGTVFADLMQELVLRPLNMTRSTFQQPLDQALMPRVAMPYRDDGTPVKGGPHTYPEQAAAGLWTTPSDLARFAIGVQDALSGKPNAVLSITAAHIMLRPEIHTQAIGLNTGGTAPNVYFSHTGGNEGYRCELLAYQRGEGVVVMTNGDGGWELIKDLVRTVAHDRGWPDFLPAERDQVAIDPQSFDRYVGAYRLPAGDIVTFWREGAHLKSRISGQAVTEIFPSSDREFFLKVMDARWIFDNIDGVTKNTTLYQDNRHLAATRLDEPDASEALQKSIATEKRSKAQAPEASSESALLNTIEGIRSGKPDYDAMSPRISEITRDDLPGLQKIITDLGSVQAISFKRVLPNGADAYSVAFANGVREFRILIGFKGLIDSIDFTP